MGLQNGDVIQQVNEYSLNNPITIFFAMSALRSAPQLVARILRGNTVRVHTYYVR
jgi:type II secretory pathway component PulC